MSALIESEAAPIDGGYVVKRTPGREHATFASAGAEAVRLTEQYPGAPFLVLKVVGIAQRPDALREAA